MSHGVKWLDEPEDHDYPAAEEYLTLLVAKIHAGEWADKLRKAPMTKFKAKDILRASTVNLLGVSNSHVAKNLDKVKDGKPLSPVLLVRMNKLVIADGYHRVCAVYQLDEDAYVPCKIV
jgi:hypothetical protein